MAPFVLNRGIDSIDRTMAKESKSKTSSSSSLRSVRIKSPDTTGRRRRVIFTLNAPEAKEAAVAGTFNDWKPDPLKPPAKNGGAGALSRTVYLPPGDYEYKFVVDGNWTNDPACADVVSNTFGTTNSLLRVS